MGYAYDIQFSLTKEGHLVTSHSMDDPGARDAE